MAVANVNGNGAGLYLSTSDYWLGLGVANGNGAAVLAAGTCDGGGILAANANGAALTINPLNIRSGAASVLGADFSASPRAGTAPLEVSFTDLSTVALDPIETWSWTFGDPDGGTSTEQNPSYAYDMAGTYTVSLTVTTMSDGDLETKTGYITVDEAQVPAAGGLALALLAGALAAAGGGVLRRRILLSKETTARII
ncbi:MAG: PKD domain-containing protein [bacterium]|nr:PKD domain-containing protein [bacterium]